MRHTAVHPTPATLLAVTVLLLVPACGDDGGGDEATESTREVETTPVTFGAGDEVWLRIQTGGGLVPAIVNQRVVPSALLFDDGRLVRRVDDGGAVVPELEVAQLDEHEVAGLLDVARAVVTGPDVGTPGVTDSPTTEIEVVVDGALRSLSVYAPGFTDGLSPAQVAARQAVDDLVAAVASAGEGEPFVPEEWLVLTSFLGPSTDAGGSVDWPLEAERMASPTEPFVCTRVTGDEVEAVLAPLSEVDGATVVAGEAGTAEVAVRPVLTGDETCNLGPGDTYVER